MRALDSAPSHIQNEFKMLAPLILQVLGERDFPKRQENQFDFLAESFAARGHVSARRSRGICGERRAIERAESPYRILRKEFYVECTCGMKDRRVITLVRNAAQKSHYRWRDRSDQGSFDRFPCGSRNVRT